ncbi:probable LRR receptor-like serine/threonine-protein kinase At3g47570 [Papaver somniferum]|nr:probable LRR receptor-like serine/threonine-protein kinase At3g47570 [Papaver somniferum]
MEMKLLHRSLILIISCMSVSVNCLIVINRAKSNDRLALVAFKNGITEDPLGALSSWNNNNDSLHFCKWKGVTCSHRHPNRVTRLDLQSKSLVCSISPHIGNLSFLTDLILNSNSLNKEIPQQIGRLFRLKRLNLSRNILDGEIPSNISRCSNLIHLDISQNNLVGSIPDELGYLSNVKVLWLQYNNFSGEIPTSLGNVSTSLTHLGLGYNNLDRIIPNTLSQLTRLKFLDITSNKLSGIVPSSLYNISSLEVFSLMFNQLHGTIPFDIGLTLPNITSFSVSGNSFTGIIPNSFANSSSLKVLQLYKNNFVGSLPYNLGHFNNLIRLNLGENDLGSGRANDLDFINSLINCTSLKVIFLGVNNFGGMLPSSIGNLTTDLDTLHLAENQIYGSIPAGIQDLVGLRSLVLAGNLLAGGIPPGIGNLQNLGVLDLRRNKLSGSVPSSFGNLTRLIELTLSFNILTDSIPPSIGNCESLQSLVLSSNRLTGSIPKQVLELSSLSRFLNLGNNSLTGPLPVEVGSLKNLGILDLSENKLSGQIPSSIGECLSLTGLFLDGNYFQGNIPPAITFLRGLESLSLSRNNLSGIIPESLENLKLSKLNLSFNNLEGVVPRYGVFMNISAFSVDGNRKLCGGIPDLKLPNCNISRKKRHVKIIIIIVIVIVVLFLISVMFLLVLYWRTKSETKPPLTALDVGNQYMGVSYNELLKATNGFDRSTNLLGVGSFGSVYKGILSQDESKPVAVKVIQLQQRGATKSFMAECDTLREIRHRNLLKIVTCCSSIDFQGNSFKALVFEFMANGNLDNWLHSDASSVDSDDQLQPKNLTLDRRLNIAVDVASALNYLHHECQSPIIHCDLKPSNVLLDDDLIAHVGDFGLSKFLSNPSSYSQHLNEQDASSIAIKGSIGYISPEYGMGGAASTEGDVYSYGILLLEMFTGKRPTDDMFKDGLDIHNFSKMHMLPDRIEEIVDSRLLSELGEVHNDDETISYDVSANERRNIARDKMRQTLTSIIQIGVKCSSKLPSDRINMSKAILDVQAVKNLFLGGEM